MNQFIVAEISKNWRDGREVVPGSGLLAQQFERVIAYNGARGYRLQQFRVHRMMTGPDELNEMIVAVFELTTREKQMDNATRFERPENDPPRPDRDPNPEERRDWEPIQVNDHDTTERLTIVGGWLYRTTTGAGVSLVFVPGE